MTVRKNILAISGSTRADATSNHLIKAIANLYEEELNITLFENIATLPHFNPDDDKEVVAKAVADFRQQIQEVDGVIICTPEYAHGVPGTLKNAIDWTVSSADFSNKPTVLITASTDGRFGHAALLETLKVIEAKDVESLQLIIRFVKTKVGSDATIIHAETLAAVKKLMNDFIETLAKN
ncbi:hypothetical protein BH10BAC3_BH10BAC3_11620 [soil metagenome]